MPGADGVRVAGRQSINGPTVRIAIEVGLGGARLHECIPAGHMVDRTFCGGVG